MRVLIVTNMFPTADAPSAGIFVDEHVRALASLGVDPEVFFVNGGRSRREYATALPRLVRTLSKGSFQVINTHHSYCTLQVALARLSNRRCPPVVFTMHEGESFLPPGERDPTADSIKRLVYSKRIKRWAAAVADHLVVVSPGLAAAIAFRGRYEVIPAGVDMGRFRPMDRRSCRSSLGLAPEIPVVFFPGSPDRDFNKGYSMFRDAMRLLRTPVEVLTGGTIHPHQMPVYLNAADVVVQTSRFEASPMVVKEALACERPLVSTAVGDVPELCRDLTGCLICGLDSEDIARTIESALALQGEAPGGRARLAERRLTLGAVAGRYADLYQRVFEEAG
jgi:teichuronic acid biosynthesis glycosyltransferase TuaC